MKNTKEIIIQEAMEIMWFKGYKNTSINKILEKSGLSKGAFFHYFKDKDSLLLDVCNHFYEKEILQILEELEKKFSNPKDIIVNFCTSINDSYKKYNFDGGCLLGNIGLELSDINENIRITLVEIFHKWNQKLQDILKNNYKNYEEISEYIIWGLQGITLTAKIHKSSEKNKTEFKMFLTILETLMK